MTQSLLQHRREAIEKSAMLQRRTATSATRSQLRDSALARWDGEGGAGPGGPDWLPSCPAQGGVATNTGGTT